MSRPPPRLSRSYGSAHVGANSGGSWVKPGPTEDATGMSDVACGWTKCGTQISLTCVTPHNNWPFVVLSQTRLRSANSFRSFCSDKRTSSREAETPPEPLSFVIPDLIGDPRFFSLSLRHPSSGASTSPMRPLGRWARTNHRASPVRSVQAKEVKQSSSTGVDNCFFPV